MTYLLRILKEIPLWLFGESCCGPFVILYTFSTFSKIMVRVFRYSMKIYAVILAFQHIAIGYLSTIIK